MKKIKYFMLTALCVALSTAFVACDDDDDYKRFWRDVVSAQVTLKTGDDGNTYFQIDKNTVARPVNISGELFDGKELRALTQFRFEGEPVIVGDNKTYDVNVLWVDSILTKKPVATLGESQDSDNYGQDRLEISRDWMTVAEDGYINLHFLTRWGMSGVRHRINLMSDVNPDNPFEFRLRHDAQGDVQGNLGYGIVAFSIKEIIERVGSKPDAVTIVFDSYEGTKTAVLKYEGGSNTTSQELSQASSRSVAVE
ncbi:MAG: NigD-like protein [Muribaculaceae bacterium]